MKSIIEILNLSKNFDNKNILKKINLKITKGGILSNYWKIRIRKISVNEMCTWHFKT